MEHKKNGRARFVLSVLLTAVLTVALVFVCFGIGEDGLIKKIETLVNAENNTPQEETTAEELLAEKKQQLAEYRALLSSPYMAVVDKTTPAVFADESTLTEVEGALLEAEAAEQLKLFLAAVREAGITVTVADGYRTAEEQTKLYEAAVASMISAGHGQEEAETLAGRIRAEAGYSEHHTGLAVDLYETTSVSATEMKKTAFYSFAKEHCAEYGFIISYSDTNTVLTGYDEKPWHFRYIGSKKDAQYIMEMDITLAADVSYLKNTVASLAAQLGE